MRPYTDDEMEFFTGSPRRKHVPVLSAVDLRSPKKFILKKTNISTVDCVARKTKLETKAEDVLPLIAWKKQQKFGKRRKNFWTMHR